MWFINNLGTLGVFLSLLPLLYLVRPMLKPCKKLLSVYKLRKYLKANLFWGTPYRFMHESYIFMVICAIINLKLLYFLTKGWARRSLLERGAI